MPTREAVPCWLVHVPGLQPAVSRPRLVEALGEGLARHLILVCAPAGFGRRRCWLTGPALAGGR